MAIWGVTSLPPQFGQAMFPAARSAAVSTPSKLFLQLSHMNSYLGIGFLPSYLTSLFANGPKRVCFCGVLGPYRCLVMTFRILATSNIKNSMTFLIAEPPLRRADHQRYQGDPAHRNATA